LYVKYRVADYKGENLENIAMINKEILDDYNKLYEEYIIYGILSPVDSDFFWILQHYVEHNGVERPKEIKIKIDWDNDG
jgi:hypothetical protein